MDAVCQAVDVTSQPGFDSTFEGNQVRGRTMEEKALWIVKKLIGFKMPPSVYRALKRHIKGELNVAEGALLREQHAGEQQRRFDKKTILARQMLERSRGFIKQSESQLAENLSGAGDFSAMTSADAEGAGQILEAASKTFTGTPDGLFGKYFFNKTYLEHVFNSIFDLQKKILTGQIKDSFNLLGNIVKEHLRILDGSQERKTGDESDFKVVFESPQTYQTHLPKEGLDYWFGETVNPNVPRGSKMVLLVDLKNTLSRTFSESQTEVILVHVGVLILVL